MLFKTKKDTDSQTFPIKPIRPEDPWILNGEQVGKLCFKAPGFIYLWFDKDNKDYCSLYFRNPVLYAGIDHVHYKDAISMLEKSLFETLDNYEKMLPELKGINAIRGRITMNWIRKNVEIIK